ncbi:Transglutaminase-like superfamily protein [Flavobacterium swingsii]|uniref:Transglutaminase-like superfamily protein n=1 Tax=Flavobacterium swingsii TaxID=498292 RepID=A0A1I0WDB8_9FLAO|nr:transglutaminase domain-containing protein [Flavobacterium swingsii]SFA86631.1 Transglutaminase-like superfamily protein [Flavobacterium swingsii]
MKQIKFIFFLILTTQILFAQKTVVNEYSIIDKKVLQIPDSLTKTTGGIASYITENFKTDKDKSRAIFIWIASNIRYDIDNMFAMNFYEKKEDKIAKPLKTRKGICENYASLFTDICLKSGMKSFVIEGYTKQNGKVDTIPHAWCAVLLDGSWFLFDPTWGSGYVNEGKFFKKINNQYYKVNPSSLIKSHMPFDYLWQFLNYPVTNQEFYQGKTQQNKTKIFFDFKDSIQLYEKQNHIDQLISSAYRVEKNGVKNSLVFDRLQHLKLEIENEKQTKTVNLYNLVVIDYNEGIIRFNDFINYRNKQFTPNKTDSEIQTMIDISDNKLKEAKNKLGQISNADANTTNMIMQVAKSIDDAIIHVNEQEDWLKVYFSKGKSGRKSMFYERKSTLFGIPLN